MGDERVCLGVIAGAQGVRGQVRIKSFTEHPADVAAYGPLSDEAGRRRFSMTVVGRAKGVVVVAIEGIAERAAAEALRGTRLFVERQALPALDEPECFYHADLIGLSAEDRLGRPLGLVRAVHNFGAGDLIEIETAEGATLTVPFTKHAVPLVDLDAGRLVAAPPPESDSESDSESGSELAADRIRSGQSGQGAS